MKSVFFALMALIGFNISVSYGQDVAQDRIFKGWFLSPHEFPWMVKLKVRNKEILESFLFCMYLGSFTLPLHKAK